MRDHSTAFFVARFFGEDRPPANGPVLAKSTNKLLSGNMSFERINYGSPLHPARFISNYQGHHYMYEAGPNDTRIIWSSRILLEACLQPFESIYELDRNEADEAVLKCGIVGEQARTIHGSTAEVLEMAQGDPPISLELTFQGIGFLWTAPQQIFEDRTEKFAETGIIAEALDVSKLSELIRATTSSLPFYERSDREIMVMTGDEPTKLALI